MSRFRISGMSFTTYICSQRIVAKIPNVIHKHLKYKLRKMYQLDKSLVTEEIISRAPFWKVASDY